MQARQGSLTWLPASVPAGTVMGTVKSEVKSRSLRLPVSTLLARLPLPMMVVPRSTATVPPGAREMPRSAFAAELEYNATAAILPSCPFVANRIAAGLDVYCLLEHQKIAPAWRHTSATSDETERGAAVA